MSLKLILFQKVFFNIEDTNNLESFEAKLCEVGRIMKKAVVENEKQPNSSVFLIKLE